MYERLETEIHNILSEEFNNLKKGIHKIKIPCNECFEYFFTLFCENKINNFDQKEWETRKKGSSKFVSKLWTNDRLAIFKENVKKYQNETNWRLLFKDEE
ncbi:hypothetical protein [Spiroplasma clarkii]|uniref:Uncharacterized protein n=1 Tax=Spiroplasma clarkii TaxID=2139 RepID=A0A2K8KKF9_9MOLU|nr:hypothetical protein [Spiroplasma clarkii]ATX70731.1 hypothetical protein SCLAR_v1c04030 [Spiroplasma clarkii]